MSLNYQEMRHDSFYNQESELLEEDKEDFDEDDDDNEDT